MIAGCNTAEKPIEKTVLCCISVDGCGYSVKSIDPDEELISDVSIMIFDERGEAEECLWLRNGETSVEIPLVTGKTYSFRACANFGYRTFADHISELDETVFYMAYPDEYSKGMPMYAAVDGIRIGEDATVNLKMKRLMARISLRMDRRKLSKGIEMNVIGVRIGNCPKSVRVFGTSRVSSHDQCFGMGFSRNDAQTAALNTLTNDNLSGAVTLYMLENMQGDISEPIDSDSGKVFNEQDYRKDVCSYIEMDIEYLSHEKYSESPLVYRFYLGESRTNLDVERNCHYRITVCPEDDGLNGDGWRVDKSGIYDLGPTYFKSYPEPYIRGKIGDKVHIGCTFSPPNTPFDVGESYMKDDKETGIYDYEIDPDGHGAVLTLTGPGRGWIYMVAGEPVNDGALFVIEVDLPSAGQPLQTPDMLTHITPMGYFGPTRAGSHVGKPT